MDANSNIDPPDPQGERVSPPAKGRRMPVLRGVRGSLWGMGFLLLWDVVIMGSFGMSILICPIWFVVGLLKNAVQEPGWRLAVVRVSIPLVTLALVFGNSNLQYYIGERNIQRVICACEEYHAANGEYPSELEELVPRHLESIPRAKYCLMLDKFVYISMGGQTMLVWYVIPLYGRKVYKFEDRIWRFVD